MINININDISNKVRATLLTGLNVALTGAIAATDTVLEAFGKLQNQITSISNQIGDFVTLNTNQTITAQKNFQTSNNSPTIIATHTSGSGAVLQINKDGNGEGIVINKNSGSGEALELNGGSSIHNSELASTLAHFDSNKVLKSVPAITANRALVSDANGIPVASSVTNTTLGFLDATSSVQTQLNRKVGFIDNFSTPTIIASGGAANTVAHTVYVPANTLPSSCQLEVINSWSRVSGTAGAFRPEIWINTVNNFATATRLARSADVSTGQSWGGIFRSITINGGFRYNISNLMAIATDLGSTTLAVEIVAIDVTQDIYIYITGVRSNTADQIILLRNYIKII